MRRVFNMGLVLMFCCMVQNALGQSVARPADSVRRAVRPTPKTIKPTGPKPIRHELSGGLRLNSDGWSAYMDMGKVKFKNIKTADMYYHSSLWQVELTEKKSLKQEKTVVDDGTGNTNSYFYGKINNFYALKFGFGASKMLAGKPDIGSVSIHWVNIFGVSLGMLKPYYINVYGDPSAIRYSEDTKKEFLTQVSSNGMPYITGSAGFSKGLSEMTFIPGAHFKSALHFDFSSNRKSVLAGEVGFNVEYYTSAIPLMANQDPQQYFVDLFLAVQFGKRW